MNKKQNHLKIQFLLAIALLLGLAIKISLTSPTALAQDILASESGNVFDISALGIQFVPNLGQTDSAVLYQVNGTTGELFFKSHSLVFVLPQPNQAETSVYSAVELEFIGRNDASYIETLEALNGKVNYFRGSDSNAWLTNLPSYSGLAYRNIYEGIDLSYFGTEGQLKSTFTVAPDVNPAQIQWQYRGAERTWIDASGNLMIQLVGGAILREQAPIAWQEINGAKHEVSVAFRVDADGLVDFAIGDYDSNYTLILDPLIEYSSYAGGSTQDKVAAIAADANGFVYVVGNSESANFPTTIGALSITRQGPSDAYVMKINTNASGAASLVWSSYLGGGGGDSAEDVDLDPDGNIYVVGTTSYTASPTVSFPLTGSAYQSTFPSCCVGHAFLTKLDPTGTTLLYSSYLGGTLSDEAYGVSADSNGNAYIVGATGSTNFPTTANAYQTVLQAFSKVFLSKIDTNASGTASLVYSTYIDANDFEGITEVDSDDEGNAYITGATESTNFPTVRAYQPNLKVNGLGDGLDVYIMRFDTTLSGTASLVYSTYFGGQFSVINPVQAGVEAYVLPGGNIVTDGDGIVYIAGRTNSADLPIVNGYQITNSGGIYDAFIAKFDTNLSGVSSLLYSSYLGGNDIDEAYGLALDSGIVYVTGVTGSTTFPLVNNFSIPATIGEIAGFLSRVDTNASGTASLLSSTKLIGVGFQPIGGNAFASPSRVYLAGEIFNLNTSVVGGFQTSSAGGTDAFVVGLEYQADLEVTRTESSAVLPLGSSRSYTLTVTNPGTDTASNVVLIEDLAEIGVVNTATSTKGTCEIVDTVVTCYLGNMFTTTSATISINFTSDTADTFTKTATVTANELDPNMANNSHEGNTLVVNTTDLSVSQIDSPDPVVATEELTYSITVSNNGSFDATNVVLTDNLPTGAAYVSAIASQGTGCSIAANKVTCNLGTIPVSGTATAEVIVTKATAGTMNHLVSVTSTEIDSNTGNNSSLITTTVLPPPPAIPTLLSPANNATVASLTPTFTWTWPTGASRYEIQIDPTPAMTAPVVAVAGASYIPTGALLTTTYHWRVRAFNSSGVPSEWSNVNQVTISSPNNVAPLTNYYTTNTPTLTWNNITWATQYEIQVDSSSNFTAPLEFTITVSASNLSVTTTALAEGTHYWRVRAINGTTLGAWSSTALFLVDIP
jgi:uncharacterized repeat protein (TIGR01451 family)